MWIKPYILQAVEKCVQRQLHFHARKVLADAHMRTIAKRDMSFLFREKYRPHEGRAKEMGRGWQRQCTPSRQMPSRSEAESTTSRVVIRSSAVMGTPHRKPSSMACGTSDRSR